MTSDPTKPTPWEEDSLVCGVAEKIGMQVLRSESIRVTDEAALKRQGLLRSTPDYPKIRRLLNSGIPVSGVERGGYEYIFRRSQKEGQRGDQDTADD